MSDSAQPTRVLSIQSHVVSGYVGNRAATFPLQLLGHEVDVINTVQFSNHTGYNSFRGERFPASHVLDLYAGLEANGLDSGYTHLLTGYMGNSENIRAVKEIASKLIAKTPNLIFVLDPVLGDDNALYVPQELVAMYRDVLCPLAKLVLPNQFEAEQLTEMKIRSTEDAKRACDKLHSFGVPNVIITSINVEGDSSQLHLIGSERIQETGGDAITHQFCISFPKLDGYFTGSGDFFAALVLARHASLSPQFGGGRLGALARACELAIATQAGVMSATRNYQAATGVPAPATNLVRGSRPADMVRGFELRIIPSQQLIANPTMQFAAVDI
ncbi:putative pyridoxal kinase [Coemansia aciculifera]|uniref:Pyridoxal kinase n=1 Tax=Coemansia aciculifera TaxID=417176 RepID=A0ACC1LUW2_9FUNG|nr:putative pyridoxal kinase [Coemansia aciculifera]